MAGSASRVDERDGKFFITELVGHAPAARAGLKTGETVIAIDGDLTSYASSGGARPAARAFRGTRC